MSAEAAGLRVRSKVKALTGPDFGFSDQGSLHFPGSINTRGTKIYATKALRRNKCT